MARRGCALKVVVTAFIGVGIALAFLFGLVRGFDAVAVAIFVAIVAAGILGIAIVNKWGRGAVIPAQCGECGGVISPHAPYCKHCGAPVAT